MRKQTLQIVKEFQRALDKVANRIKTAKARDHQLYWKNYKKWYLSLIRKTKSAFRRLKRTLASDELTEILEELEAPLAVIFEVETPTNKKYEELQKATDIWGNFLYELDRRITAEHDIFPLRDFEVDEKLCFVLMPFDQKYNQVYKESIKPAVRRAKLRCRRADDIYGVSPIIQDIWKYINTATLIIADLSDRNPNVFYELGLSHVLPKRVILITQKREDVPFDLKYIRYILYQNTRKGRKKLAVDLFKTIRSTLS